MRYAIAVLSVALVLAGCGGGSEISPLVAPVAPPDVEEDQPSAPVDEPAPELAPVDEEMAARIDDEAALIAAIEEDAPEAVGPELEPATEPEVEDLAPEPVVDVAPVDEPAWIIDDHGRQTFDVAETGGAVSFISSSADIYDEWGLWASDGERVLFAAYLDGERRHYLEGSAQSGLIDDTITAHVFGVQSGSNPVSGSAVWTGGVRAIHVSSTHFGYDEETDQTYLITGRPYRGDARVDVDFLAGTVGVSLTDLASGPFLWPDMEWESLRLSHGGFRDGTLEGAFYGDSHEGVAGTFARDNMRGVFGALREGE